MEIQFVFPKLSLSPVNYNYSITLFLIYKKALVCYGVTPAEKENS